MCEFCLKHGEGKKWYLQAKNYSEDLLSDMRRIKMIEGFFNDVDSAPGLVERLQKLDSAPGILKRFVRWRVPKKMKKVHFGQVVPLEDIERIFDMVNSITRVACFCRHVTVGKESRYCYGISMGPNGGKIGDIMRNLDDSFLNGPDTAGLEELSKEEVLSAFKEHEKEGLCHTVWTFQTPFIGGICNCDRTDCLAMKSTVIHKVPLMFRAEYVADVNPDFCTGCRQCMRVCQFGAISYSAANEKAVIDPRVCYGCGVCRAACKKDAIHLAEREAHPIAARLWQ